MIAIIAMSERKIYHFALSLGTTPQFVLTGAYAFKVNGLVGSDTVSAVTLTSAGASAAAAPGTYTLVPSAAVAGAGTDLSNYQINFASAYLLVANAGLVGLNSVSVGATGATIDSFDSSLGAYGSSNHGAAALVSSNSLVSLYDHLVLSGGVISALGSVSVGTYVTVTGDVLAGLPITNHGHINGSAGRWGSCLRPIGTSVGSTSSSSCARSGAAGIGREAGKPWSAASRDAGRSASRTITAGSGVLARRAAEIGTDVHERLQPVPNKPHIPDDVVPLVRRRLDTAAVDGPGRSRTSARSFEGFRSVH